MHILIDADLLVYKAGHGAKMEPLSHALYIVKRMLVSYKERLAEHFTIDKVTLYLTSDDKSNFRLDIAKTKEYKGHRKEESKPLHYKEIREYLINVHHAIVIGGKEADDELGIVCSKDPENCVIVSADKDMRMIEGWHWEMGDKPPYYVADPGILLLERKYGKKSKLFGTGLAWFYAQMLLGDIADNIPGIKGYGDVKTYKTLCGCGTVDQLKEAVYNIYKEQKVEDRFDEVYQLLWIHRSEEDIDGR